MKRLSLQWRITLMSVLLIGITCVAMNLLLCSSGVYYMDTIADSLQGGGTVILNEGGAASFDPQLVAPSEELTIVVDGAQGRFRTTNWYITAIVTLLSGILAYFVSGRALKPLHSFASQVEKVQLNNLADVRIDEDVLPEFRQLSHSFNQMLERLNNAFTAQRQFTGNAAHELRTPLALMQAQLELFSAEHTDVLPTTSQAAPNDFIKEFEKAKQAGEAAVVITLASRFSGTYQSAVIAAEDYENIYVVDGASAAMGTGILVELAFRLLDAGASAQEIAKAMETEKEKIVVVALVDTLEYLKRGGRISKTAAFAGGVLNIKPVLSVIDGEIHLLGKARGSKMGNNLLVQEIDKAGGIDFSKPVLLGYSGLSDALLLKYIEDSRHIWEGNLKEVRYTTVGSVIGTHAGPGAVVVAFFKND